MLVIISPPRAQRLSMCHLMVCLATPCLIGCSIKGFRTVTMAFPVRRSGGRSSSRQTIHRDPGNRLIPSGMRRTRQMIYKEAKKTGSSAFIRCGRGIMLLTMILNQCYPLVCTLWQRRPRSDGGTVAALSSRHWAISQVSCCREWPLISIRLRVSVIAWQGQ